MVTWRSWSGLATAEPRRLVTPRDTAEVVAEVEAARARGGAVKMVGSGHSFTPIAVADDVLLQPGGRTGVVSVDRAAMTVTAYAGTRLADLNAQLERLGLSLHNMGDVAEQTLAGAISTGTHGTGGLVAGLAAQVAGLELVTGTGEVLRCTATENADVLELARVGLGALGVLTTITFRVEPLFLLEAHERPLRWADLLGHFDELTAEHHHVDAYWFPHTDRVLAKTNDRLDAEVDTAEPVSRLRGWVDDELLANAVFGLENRLLRRLPAAVPRANRINARLLGERRYSDVAHRVFVSRRSVRFREMEYAVPREVGLDVLAECRRAVEASRLRISFPVELRVARADDVPLSTAFERDSFYLAFHTYRDVDHTAYFALVEPILRDAGGRPHWGKLHSLGFRDLAEVHPRLPDFVALRDRLDPDRVFANAHLRRVLGS